MSVNVVVSGETVEELRAAAPEEFRARASMELVLALYSEGSISVGRAMELAGVTRRELHDALRARGQRVKAAPGHVAQELAGAGIGGDPTRVT